MLDTKCSRQTGSPTKSPIDLNVAVLSLALITGAYSAHAQGSETNAVSAGESLRPIPERPADSATTRGSPEESRLRGDRISHFEYAIAVFKGLDDRMKRLIRDDQAGPSSPVSRDTLSNAHDYLIQTAEICGEINARGRELGISTGARPICGTNLVSAIGDLRTSLSLASMHTNWNSHVAGTNQSAGGIKALRVLGLTAETTQRISLMKRVME